MTRPFAARQGRSTGELTLLCFPHAGGTAASYSRWAKSLPGLHVRPVELPGRGERLAEQPHDSMDSLITSLIGELLPELTGRFALFGHSMGALIAFEFAHRLGQRFGLCPARLVVSGSPPPDHPGPGPGRHLLPDQELWDEVRSLNGTPDDIYASDDLRRLCLPAIRADFTIVENYRCPDRRPLDCAISVLSGDADPEVVTGELSGWAAHTSAGHTVTVLPGDHFFLHHDPQLFLKTMGEELAKSRS